MRINDKYKLSFITSLIVLSMSISVPGWASSDVEIDQTAQSSDGKISELVVNDSLVGADGEVLSGQDQVTGIGAIAGNGNNNTAVGIGVQISGKIQGTVSGTGAVAGNGNNNTAVGIGVQINDSNQKPRPSIEGQFSSGDNLAIGYGAKNGTGSANKVIGSGAQAGNGDNNTALGTGSFAGGGNNSLSNLNTAIGAGAQAAMGNSVALGANSIADRPNSVSVGGPIAGDRQITNVAAGYYDTDAVNMSQLRGMDSKVNRVGATAFAFSALAPLPYDPKEPTQYSAGIGTYNGTSAVAIGIYHYTRPDVMINAAIGMSNDGWEKSARFGISWKTGGSKHKEITPAVPTYSKGNIVERVKTIIADDEIPE